MTREQQVYADTLNLLGSDVMDDPEIQSLLDQEHAKADRSFAFTLAKRYAVRCLSNPS
jgi:hypothetical protein